MTIQLIQNFVVGTIIGLINCSYKIEYVWPHKDLSRSSIEHVRNNFLLSIWGNKKNRDFKFAQETRSTLKKFKAYLNDRVISNCSWMF